MKSLKLAIIGLSLAFVLPAAQATDGVIEINDARALAGGVTPGDSAGYPVTISQSGSYRLTSNLVQPNATTYVILISHDDVTIDLNGFAITGSTTCTSSGSTPNQTIGCSPAGPAMAIAATGAYQRITVKNGSVSGIAGTCIHLGYDSLTNVSGGTVHDVQVAHCGSEGIRASTVRNSTVAWTLYGIAGRNVTDNTVSHSRKAITAYGGTVARNSALLNFGVGAQLNSYAVEAFSSVVSNNVISNNQSMGLGVAGTSLVIGNTLSYNTGVGLDVEAVTLITYGATKVIYTQNVLYGNGGSSPTVFNQIGGSPISLPAGSNYCQTQACSP